MSSAPVTINFNGNNSQVTVQIFDEAQTPSSCAKNTSRSALTRPAHYPVIKKIADNKQSIAITLFGIACIATAITLWVIYAKNSIEVANFNDKFAKATQAGADTQYLKTVYSYSWGHFDNAGQIAYVALPKLHIDFGSLPTANLLYLGGALGATLLGTLLIATGVQKAKESTAAKTKATTRALTSHAQTKALVATALAITAIAAAVILWVVYMQSGQGAEIEQINAKIAKIMEASKASPTSYVHWGIYTARDVSSLLQQLGTMQSHNIAHLGAAMSLTVVGTALLATGIYYMKQARAQQEMNLTADTSTALALPQKVTKSDTDAQAIIIASLAVATLIAAAVLWTYYMQQAATTAQLNTAVQDGTRLQAEYDFVYWKHRGEFNFGNWNRVTHDLLPPLQAARRASQMAELAPLAGAISATLLGGLQLALASMSYRRKTAQDPAKTIEAIEPAKAITTPSAPAETSEPPTYSASV